MDKEQIRSKWENFWYYYKWYVVGGAVLLASLIVGIHSCTQKVHPDLYVLFAVDKSLNSHLIAETETWLGGMTEDINGDGETTAQILSTANTDQWSGSSTAALVVQANAGDAILYILTEETYTLLHNNGILQELSGDSPYLEGDRYCLTDSGVLNEVPAYTAEEQSYYLCLRKVEGTSFEGDAKRLEQERLGKLILEKLIEKEKGGDWAVLRKEG